LRELRGHDGHVTAPRQRRRDDGLRDDRCVGPALDLRGVAGIEDWIRERVARSIIGGVEQILGIDRVVPVEVCDRPRNLVRTLPRTN
jgi:hypothetical protein